MTERSPVAPKRGHDPSPHGKPGQARRRRPESDDAQRRPPDAVPDPMPGVDRQQTPGVDRVEYEDKAFARAWFRATRGL